MENLVFVQCNKYNFLLYFCKTVALAKLRNYFHYKNKWTLLFYEYQYFALYLLVLTNTSILFGSEENSEAIMLSKFVEWTVP